MMDLSKNPEYEPAPNISDDFLYHYKAVVVSVYDADTVRIDIDWGGNFWSKNEPVRISRIDAPELRGKERPAGLIARDFLRKRILGKEVLIRTYKDKRGKYGRFIVEIIHEGENISDWLVSNGQAVYKKY